MKKKDKEKKLRCYEIVADESDCLAMSLVDCPAVELDFVYLSKQQPQQIFLEKDEKHLIVGAALIPDKPIYRCQDGEEFYIQFSRQTIEKMAHDFIKNHRTDRFTLDHMYNVGGISVVESWLKEGKGDKSSAYGFDVPDGTWMLMSKVEDPQTWAKIKNGELNGYSIEAFCGLEEINFKNMTKEVKVNQEAIEITPSFWDTLKGIIADALGKGEESKEVEDTVGEIADALEDGAGPKDEETKVVEQAEVEEIPEEEIPEAIAEEVVDTVEETAETVEEEVEDLQAVVDELNAKIAEKDAEIEELKKKNEKLSKQPSAKVVKQGAVQKQNPRDIIEALHNGTYFKK